ncbi:MAG: ABC transporter ATP-binding protein [Candidatus Methanomethylophilaceae archaeon]|nr:ABC transporter ATP-binding protein [Candidatus Methanomethylophilaceae archaeon]
MTGIFSFVRFFHRKEWVLTCFVVALIICNVWLDLEIPRYMESLTLIITTGGTTDEVMGESAGMFTCAVLSLIVTLVISIVVGWISSSTAKTIREVQFDHIQRFSLAETEKIPSYSLITRSTNDVKQVQDFIGTSLESLIRAPVISIWAVVRIGSGHETWLVATAICIIAMVVLVVTILRLVAPYYKRVQSLNDALNHVTMDALVGQRVIRAFNAQRVQRGRFEDANDNLLGNNIKANHVMATNVPFNGFIRNTLTMLIYWLGAFIISGTSDPGDRLVLFSEMMVYATYATMALNGFRSLVQIFNVFPKAKVSMERIFEVLDTEPSIVGGSVEDGKVKGSVSFEDVSFRYKGSSTDTISGVTFHADPGETVAVIGATGCGKTTMVNLVPRFYDCMSGSVKVDGVDVRDYDLDSLRGRIGYVSQKATIPSGSVRENVNYGSTSGSRSDEDIWCALDVACIKEFIEKEGGLDISLSEEGRNISGGQKQRVSIARAVCKDPEIYIFDDCFSALDFRTDLEVRRRLRNKTRDATVLLITQRISTARTADRIVVMDRGRVVDTGTHSQLLERCPLYLEMAESQRTGDEL